MFAGELATAQVEYIGLVADKTKHYVKSWIKLAVKGGFEKKSALMRDIADRVRDVGDSPNPKLVKELQAFASALLDKQRVAEAKWTGRTTNDAIDAAFAELNRAGIVALQNAGYTMSDGWDDANERARKLLKQGNKPRGAAFYHEQDLERGVAGDGLFLVFGAYEDNKKKRDAAAVAVAKDVVATLARFGVKTEWNGTVGKRIQILPFAWRRRQFSKAPK
jgi:hypothetical protein